MYGKLAHRMFATNAHWMWISRVYDQAAIFSSNVVL